MSRTSSSRVSATGRPCLACGLRQRLGFALGDEDAALRIVPDRDLVAPPELARDAPGLDVGEPLEEGLLVVLGDELGLPVAHRLEGALGERLDVHVPLVGQVRLDDHARAVAVRDRMGVRLDRRAAARAPPSGRRPPCAPAPGRGRAAPGPRARAIGPVEEGRVAVEQHPALGIEDVDQAEPVAPADIEVVEVVRRRDLDRARALLGVASTSSATIGIRRPTSGSRTRLPTSAV